MTNSGPSWLALHGFLGLTSDWSVFSESLEGLQAIDLWPIAHRAQGFAWTEDLSKDKKPILLGYSMGGRLAMHEAIARPDRYSGAVFISAHPGLLHAEERESRLANDQRWAERFLHDDWSEVVEAWNSQPVLQSRSSGLERKESDFARSSLARALDVWSLGRQRDLRLELSRLDLPVLYVTGADDSKFTQLIDELKKPICQSHIVIENSGHRLLWERPQEFTAAVLHWSRKLH